MDSNKKKLMIVALLAVSILGIGAFQFTRGGDAPKSAKKSGDKAKRLAGDAGSGASEDAASKINGIVEQNQVSEDHPEGLVYALPLPNRDPFSQGAAQLQVEAPPAAQPKPQTPPPTQRPKETWRSGPSNMPPLGLTGTFPPLPGANPSGANSPGMAGVRPDGSIPAPDAFTMTPTGVMLGSHPAVVFVDQAGNQKLVSLGGSPMEGATVVSIDKSKVRVRYQKKILTFNVGGTPNAQ